jgi:hypothetical protein
VAREVKPVTTRTTEHPVRTRRARLNIYLPDPAVRRQVKTAAARRDVSVSEYCLEAITAQLAREADLPTTEDLPLMQKTVVAEARRFQAEAFGGRVFRVTSADLIRKARGERSA